MTTASTFALGKIQFGEADYTALIGNLLIIVGFILILVVAFRSRTSESSSEASPSAAVASPVKAGGEVASDGEENTSNENTDSEVDGENKTPRGKGKKEPKVLGSLQSPEGRRSSRLIKKTK